MKMKIRKWVYILNLQNIGICKLIYYLRHLFLISSINYTIKYTTYTYILWLSQKFLFLAVLCLILSLWVHKFNISAFMSLLMNKVNFSAIKFMIYCHMLYMYYIFSSRCIYLTVLLTLKLKIISHLQNNQLLLYNMGILHNIYLLKSFVSSLYPFISYCIWFRIQFFNLHTRNRWEKVNFNVELDDKILTSPRWWKLFLNEG